MIDLILYHLLSKKELSKRDGHLKEVLLKERSRLDRNDGTKKGNRDDTLHGPHDYNREKIMADATNLSESKSYKNL
ncbi:hypothetical protein GZ77_05165 [Endozoicomonas montiporae]|uniref:Uncharacterized protein n=2 Tax=Endozoicomonas montiporae TaxID=1027273 RepID=A0A081NBS8_9GAMM|nr:hypothetical protein EZMO1_2086 [Endozoicomonas montiporae CL-33]KEQ15901.1 hypothetical protein GZ77_05165 [Endozoicomonas montiporae]